jgi:hypothetical protein
MPEPGWYSDLFSPFRLEEEAERKPEAARLKDYSQEESTLILKGSGMSRLTALGLCALEKKFGDFFGGLAVMALRF